MASPSRVQYNLTIVPIALHQYHPIIINRSFSSVDQRSCRLSYSYGFSELNPPESIWLIGDVELKVTAASATACAHLCSATQVIKTEMRGCTLVKFQVTWHVQFVLLVCFQSLISPLIVAQSYKAACVHSPKLSSSSVCECYIHNEECVRSSLVLYSFTVM